VKLLIDQNLAPELTELLADLFADSRHVHEFGLDEASDDGIAAFAEKNTYVMTKDSDFARRIAPPPHLRMNRPNLKVVWLQVKNCSVDHVHKLLRREAIRINALAEQPGTAILILS
jgi:predicted nuclease of predicted toxin-antitoxin system